MIEGKRFTFTDAEWDAIKVVVRDALGLDANQIVLDSVRADGTKHRVRLRAKIEATATLHLARDNAMRSLPTQLAFRRDVIDKRKDAERLHDWIEAVFWISHNGYKPDKDMLDANKTYFEKLYRNLDGIIAALGPPRKKTGSVASKNKGRDLFWWDLQAIWRQIGGKLPDDGVDAAKFVRAVSRPVFNAMPKRTRDTVPDDPRSIIPRLRRRSPIRQV